MIPLIPHLRHRSMYLLCMREQHASLCVLQNKPKTDDPTTN